jgi:hypothetical protein
MRQRLLNRAAQQRNSEGKFVTYPQILPSKYSRRRSTRLVRPAGNIDSLHTAFIPKPCDGRSNKPNLHGKVPDSVRWSSSTSMRAVRSFARQSSSSALFSMSLSLVLFALSLSLFASCPALAKSECLSPVAMTDKVREGMAAVSGALVSASMQECIKSSADAVIGELSSGGDTCVSLQDIGTEIGTRFGGCRRTAGESERFSSDSRAAFNADAFAFSHALISLRLARNIKREERNRLQSGLVRQQCSGPCAYCCALVTSFGYDGGQSCILRCYSSSG